MGSNTADIVARLTLNAEAFSATHGDAFRRFNDAAKKAGSDVKQSLGSAFAEIGARAKEALSMPALDGKLNLNSDGLRRQAEAAKQSAVAMREVANAAERAALSQDKASDETIAYAQASAVLAQRAEENAAALSREAIALDRIQSELGQTATATSRMIVQHGRMESAARTNQLAMRNLGFQLSDVGASAISGGNMFVIFGQQIGQVGGALSDMTGKAGVLGRFLTNPWVAALTTAGIVVGMFYTKLSETSDAMGKAGDAADDFARKQGDLSNFIDKTTGRLAEQNKYLLQNAILLRQTKIDEGNKSIADNRNAAFDKAASTRGQQFVAERQAFATTYDNEVETAIQRSRGNQFLLADELNRLATRRPDLRPQINQINELAARSIDAFKGIKSAREEIEFLSGKRTVAPGFTPSKPKKTSNAKGVALGEFGRDARDRIADIQGQFADAPSRVRQTEKALRDLDDIIDDLSRKKPLNFESAISEAEKAKVVVKESLQRPFNDLIRSAREREQIDAMILNGQFAQAGALQTVLGLERQMGPLTADQLATVQQIALAEEARARAIDDQRRKVGLYVQAVGDVQRSFEDLLTTRSVKDFGKNLLGSFKGLQTRLLSESIFGGLDRELEDFVSGRTGVNAAGEFLASQTTAAGKHLGELTDAFTAARSVFTGSAAGQGPVVASGLNSIFDDSFMADLQAEIADLNGSLGDYSGDIVVTGQKQNRAANDNTRAVIGATDAFNFIGGRLADRLKGLGIELPKEIGSQLGTLLQGASLGQLSGSIAGSITGGKQSQTGAAIGGAIGSAVAGPIGAVVGGVLGSNLGGLFKKTKKASSTLMLSDGEVLAGAASGNSASYRANAVTLGGSVSDQLNSIAEALGGNLSGSLGVSIGQRKKKFVVDTTGGGRTKGGGVLSFESEQEAVIAAVRDALSDGVLTGISQAAQNILRSGQDLEKALNKATLIESIPKLLKQRTDPAGAALDELNDKFKKIVAALKEGGASAEQMADAQKLYNLELVDAKASAGVAADSLKEFLASFKSGSASPYSLRDQEVSARAVLDPFLGQISKGEAIDQEKYLSAAQTFLDIERQLYGSTSKYFDALGEIQAATNGAIATIDKATPIRTTADPFIEATATASKSTAASTANMETLLGDVRSLLTRMANGQASPSGWIGEARNYV